MATTSHFWNRKKLDNFALHKLDFHLFSLLNSESNWYNIGPKWAEKGPKTIFKWHESLRLWTKCKFLSCFVPPWISRAILMDCPKCEIMVQNRSLCSTTTPNKNPQRGNSIIHLTPKMSAKSHPFALLVSVHAPTNLGSKLNANQYALKNPWALNSAPRFVGKWTQTKKW